MEQLNNVSYPVQELELVYKPKFKPSERPKITTSADCYRVLLSLWNPGLMDLLEEFKILLLNRASRVIGCYEVSLGGFAGTVADPKVIFAVALKSCASSIILAHNHPSGNTKPSQSDINLTHKLVGAGQLLEIDVLDHIILTSEGFYSFADEGMMR
jgi:DNA repair protein RadC